MGRIMATERLDQIFEEVKHLTQDDLKQLRIMLDDLLSNVSAQMTEEEFERRLLERGVISELRPPVTDRTNYLNRQPIEFEGKPVSEIIIEERR